MYVSCNSLDELKFVLDHKSVLQKYDNGRVSLAINNNESGLIQLRKYVYVAVQETRTEVHCHHAHFKVLYSHESQDVKGPLMRH